MCGIVGIINIDNPEKVSQGVINDMNDRLIHRGPDDSGTYLDNRVAFGHRRLTIIDLSEHGRQPMFDVTDRIGITFNGEIYNYLELRSELEAKGYKFHSNSDTEVILNSYLEHGIDCLENFIGMFAFAIYDKKDGKVILVRDRLGIKPLYYSIYDGKIIFASEVKSILAYPGFSTSENINGLSSYLSYRYPIGEDTLFENIKSLRPGYFLEIINNKQTMKQYWEIPIIDEKEDLGEEYYIEKIKELMQSSVSLRMRSDVPFGAYLSGGLDSSITVSIMSELMDDPVKTFTIGFDEEGYNEFEYAQMVADRYKTEHRQITMSSKDYIDTMVKLISFKDAPLGVANEPALHQMSKELKQYITVVLSGEGADEIFGGYGRIFRSPIDYMRMKELENADTEDSKQLRDNLKKKYGDKSFESPQDHFLFNYNYLGWNDKQEFLSSDVLAHLNKDKYLYDMFSTEFSKIEKLNVYDKYTWIFEKIHLVGLLQRVDMTTMATSVEARVPFVDHRLVEFAFSIPTKYKLKWKSIDDKVSAASLNSDQISEQYDIPKYILKKSFEDKLPSEVVWRKKVGFPVPIHKWLGEEFNSFAKEILLDQTASNRNFYNMESIEKALNDPKLLTQHNFGLKIWMLVNMELWKREYIDQAKPVGSVN